MHCSHTAVMPDLSWMDVSLPLVDDDFVAQSLATMHHSSERAEKILGTVSPASHSPSQSPPPSGHGNNNAETSPERRRGGSFLGLRATSDTNGTDSHKTPSFSRPQTPPPPVLMEVEKVSIFECQQGITHQPYLCLEFCEGDVGDDSCHVCNEWSISTLGISSPCPCTAP